MAGAESPHSNPLPQAGEGARAQPHPGPLPQAGEGVPAPSPLRGEGRGEGRAAPARLLPLCRPEDIREGTSRGFDPTRTGRDTLFIVRRDGLHAWRNRCPHWDNTSMAWRKDAFLNADGTRIVCAAHGAQFDIASGLCLIGPCIGESLTPVPLTTTDDWSLHVDPSHLET